MIVHNSHANFGILDYDSNMAFSKKLTLKILNFLGFTPLNAILRHMSMSTVAKMEKYVFDLKNAVFLYNYL